ncbi:MAG: hypothetical protein HKN23_01455 [Verrucomicrobiales bacterium]|nr:hypothetical protein [Verrucomicrobiales bacterium]
MKSILRPVALITLPVAFVVAGAVIADPEEKKISFTKQIKPIFADKCIHCHNRKTLPNRISFESRKLALGKTKEGLSYIVPGDSAKSLMITALNAPTFHEKKMPMVGPRPTKEEIELIRRWIDQGADWPTGLRGRIKPTFRAKE